MPYHFRKHYTIEEARELLPKVRQWFRQMQQSRTELERIEAEQQPLLLAGCDLGGPQTDRLVTVLTRLKELLNEFHRREIQIKDFERGLIDFPSLRQGREVFLCWEKSEADIGFWHDLDAGFAGREPLED